MRTGNVSERDLAWAIALALQMWSDDRYAGFLQRGEKTLTREWFDQFVGEWRVARTLAPDSRGKVVGQLAGAAFLTRVTDGDVRVVDEYAGRFQKNEWTSRTGTHKKAGRPVSLVSKIAFFLNPDCFVPLDSYGKVGIGKLRSALGETKSGFDAYSAYLPEFNRFFAMHEAQIREALNEPWVAALGRKMRCPVAQIRRKAFSRKVFDHVFMSIAGRYGRAEGEHS